MSEQEFAFLVASAVMSVLGIVFTRVGYLMKYHDRVDLIAGVTEHEARGTFNLITGEPKPLEPALRFAGQAFGTASMFFGLLLLGSGIVVAMFSYRRFWFWALTTVVTAVTLGTVAAVRRRASRSEPPTGPISPS